MSDEGRDYSPEPWTWKQPIYAIVDSNGIRVVGLEFICHQYQPSTSDIKRIVACVNFCRQFPTEFLVGKVLIAGEVSTIKADQ